METQKSDSDNKYSKIDDYEVIEQLGRRALGTTFLVLHRTEKKKYVLKIPLAKQTRKIPVLHIKGRQFSPISLGFGRLPQLRTKYESQVYYLQGLKVKRTGLWKAELPRKMTGADKEAVYALLPIIVKMKISSAVSISRNLEMKSPDFINNSLHTKNNGGIGVAGTRTTCALRSFTGIPYGYKSDIWSLGQGWTYQQNKPGVVLSLRLYTPPPFPSNRERKARPLPVKSRAATKKLTITWKIYQSERLQRQTVEAKEKRTVFFDESGNIQPRNLSDNYNTFRAKLETKRVDPTSYSVRISEGSEDSKSGEMSEAAVCNGYDQPETSFANRSYNYSALPSSSGKNMVEQRMLLEHVKQFEEGDRKSSKTKELEVLSSPLDNEEANTNVVECISGKPSRMTLSNERSNDEQEKKATMVYDTKQAKKRHLRALDDKVSQLKSLAALAGKEDKDDWGIPPTKAEALESLLEVCARLLKQEKMLMSLLVC
ncbi:hypothetical protein HAX54_025390 [Datura stramonium]|uniref:Uncharacterized protein n=1 Tax=Datura stramonium TaxID=4076 RepID=A0ABS8V1Q3_DATST|nr:hypothetical protein [Datura stramonium]